MGEIMTAPTSDSVWIDGRRYDLCGVQGEGLFNPGIFDIDVESPGTACWRGFTCAYEIRGHHLYLAELELWSDPTLWRRNRAKLADLFGEEAQIDGTHPLVDVTDMLFPIQFTGGLLVGDDFISELYDGLGFQPAYAYREVQELTFESGLLLAQSDCSMAMLEVRLRQGMRGGDEPRNLSAWIYDSFGMDF
jgi:hypothetical protein